MLQDLWEKILALGWEAAIAAGIFIGVFLLGKFLLRNIFKVLIRMSRKTQLDFDTKLLLAFERPLQAFSLVLGFYLAVNYLPLGEPYNLLASRIFRSGVILFIAAGLYNLMDDQSFIFDEMKTKFNLELDRILVPFLSKIARVLIIILALAMVADEWGFEVVGIFTGLGLGGLALALAAQDTVSNLFGGVVIVTDKPFSIGDWIHTPSVEGTVEDINFRSTRIRTFAHALVTVPNATLVKEPITNWTRMGKRRISFHLGVTYSTTREQMQNCVKNIQEMLENHPGIHKETIFVRFDNFNDSSLDIFIYCFTITTRWGEFLEVKEDVNLKIMEILENEGVSVAFPSRSLYIEKPGE